MKILLIVDMQSGFITKPNYKDLQNKIDKLIVEKKYDKYIFTKFVNQENSLYKTSLKWNDLSDKNSQKLCVTIPQNSIILNKNGYGLDDEELTKITQLGADQIDICGLQTDACVYAIALQLWDKNIFPNILKNYVATAPERQNVAIEMLIHQFGSVDEKM